MKKQIRYFIFSLFFLGSLSSVGYAQERNVKIVSIGFYNLENLFDTIDDPNTNDEEFTPNGSSHWDSKRYEEKLHHLAEVIGQIGDEYIKTGPAVMGFSEVENRKVVEDLVNTPPLDKMGYRIVHYDSPDRRGIDVTLIYQPGIFQYAGSKVHPLKIEGKDDFYTRDVLEVTGTIDDEPFCFLVNHWPSRSRGTRESQPLRNAAADNCLKAVQDVRKANPDTKIIIMGDLNDDPTDVSLEKHLGAKGKPDNLGKNDLYNPMVSLFKKGIGSLAYQDSWNLFDQMIVSSNLMKKDSPGFRFFVARVFIKDFLKQKEGAYAGYPYRTYAGGVYLGGYSDHFPVYLFLVKDM